MLSSDAVALRRKTGLYVITASGVASLAGLAALLVWGVYNQAFVRKVTCAMVGFESLDRGHLGAKVTCSGMEYSIGGDAVHRIAMYLYEHLRRPGIECSLRRGGWVDECSIVVPKKE